MIHIKKRPNNEDHHEGSYFHKYILSLFILIQVLLPLFALKAQTPDPKFDDYLASVRELLPADGTLLYDCSVMAGYQFYSQDANTLHVFDVEDDEVPFSQAWRATITEIGDYWWDTGFITPPNTSAIEEGDLLFWVFYARTNEVDELIGLAKAGFAAQVTEPPFTSIVQTFTYPQTGWTRFYVYTEATTGYGPGDLQGTMHFEFFEQIIEFGGFIALNLGQGIDPADLPANEAMIDSKFDENLALVRELLPVDGTLLFDCADLSGYNYYGNLSANTFSMINTEEDVPFAKAYRIQLNEFIETWEQLIWPSNADSIHQGDMVLFVFYARSVVPQQEIGWTFSATSGMATPEWYDLAALEMTSPPDEWTRYYFFGRARIDHDVRKLHTLIHLSPFPKIIDIGGFVALNLGQGIQYADLPYNTITYIGQEPDAPWREAAQERIEEHRMGDMTVTVIDQSGEPVVGAEISVTMKRHAFPFGTAPFWMFNIWQSPDAMIYREKLLNLFNAATTPFFMGTDDWGWYAQPESRPINIAMAEWLHQHNMSISGTTLIYPGWWQMPSFFFDLADDPEALHTALIHHLDTIVPLGRDAGVDSWDVINEHSLASEVMDILGDEVLIDWFEHTHFLHPEAELGINEWGILMGGGLEALHTNLKYLINILQNANAPLHRLGFQSHFISYLPSPEVIFEILEDFSVYGLNIHISEFDINMDDLQTQADYTRDFMTIIFSHPSVNRFTKWGFWEQSMYTPKGAMFRTDWTEKPNYYAYTDLVFDQWWTEEEGSTNELGEFFVRGFLGDYEITVVKDGLVVTQEATLVKEGTTVTVVHKEPPVTYYLDLDVQPYGACIINGSGMYEMGAQVNISVEANPACIFVNWSGDIDYVDDTDLENATVTMPAYDVSLIANFECTGIAVTLNLDMSYAPYFNPQYDLVYVTGTFAGYWPIPGADPDYQLMTRVGETMIWTKTLFLEEGVYEYKYFINYGFFNGEWGEGNNREIIVTGDMVMNDHWGHLILELDAQPGAAGTVSGGGVYPYGAVIEIEAEPLSGWEFLNWTGDTGHVADTTSAATSVTIPTFDIALTAKFENIHHLTLNLDMRRNSYFNPDTDLVHVTGTLIGSWPVPGADPDNQVMTRVGESMIWTKEFYLKEGEYEYKYFLNEGWDGGEWSGATNRNISLENDMTVYNAWGMMGEAYSVTFTVKDDNDHAIHYAVLTVHGFTFNAGEYEIGYLPSGQYDYHVHHNDYEDATGHFTISGENVLVSVVMTAIDTATENVENIEIKVFPNPVQNTLYIMANIPMNEIKLIDMLARPVLTMKSENTKYELNVSGIKQGIYFIKVITNKGVKTLPVMLLN